MLSNILISQAKTTLIIYNELLNAENKEQLLNFIPKYKRKRNRWKETSSSFNSFGITLLVAKKNNRIVGVVSIDKE